MKLIKINGDITELTMLWESPFDNKDPKNIPEINEAAITEGRDGCCSGCVRFLSDGKVRSKASAVIDIGHGDYKSYETYTIYYSKKGFYCNVQRKRVFLKDLERGATA